MSDLKVLDYLHSLNAEERAKLLAEQQARVPSVIEEAAQVLSLLPENIDEVVLSNAESIFRGGAYVFTAARKGHGWASKFTPAVRDQVVLTLRSQLGGKVFVSVHDEGVASLYTFVFSLAE
jgi:uncharacterized lipoprotein YmbA